MNWAKNIEDQKMKSHSHTFFKTFKHTLTQQFLSLSNLPVKARHKKMIKECSKINGGKNDYSAVTANENET